MLGIQKITMAFIVLPGLSLGIAAIVLRKNIGLWLLRYGLIIAVPGVLLSLLANKDLFDVLFLIDASGFGRMYIVGCALLFAGLVVQSWQVIRTLITKIN